LGGSPIADLIAMWSVYCKLGHPDKRHGRNWGERGAGKRTSFRDHIVGHNWALRVDGQISKGTDNGLKYISDPVELAPLTAKPASKLVWDICIYQSMTTCILSSSGGTFNETVLREPRLIVVVVGAEFPSFWTRAGSVAPRRQTRMNCTR